MAATLMRRHRHFFFFLSDLNETELEQNYDNTENLTESFISFTMIFYLLYQLWPQQHCVQP